MLYCQEVDDKIDSHVCVLSLVVISIAKHKDSQWETVGLATRLHDVPLYCHNTNRNAKLTICGFKRSYLV